LTVDVAILDYGSGNLHSLAKALQRVGASPRVVAEPAAAVSAQALVLPGVGAFGDAAARLRPGLATLRRALAGGLPCLGICLGMQLLFAASDEGEGEGLAVLPGRVRRLRGPRLPHMGWNDVEPARPDPLLPDSLLPDPLPPDSLLPDLAPLTAYFAHSYAAEPADRAQVLAWTTFGEERFPSAVRCGAVVGVQFHPEKSAEPGLALLGRFVGGLR
jgi:glutamine amidotransferase